MHVRSKTLHRHDITTCLQPNDKVKRWNHAGEGIPFHAQQSATAICYGERKNIQQGGNIRSGTERGVWQALDGAVQGMGAGGEGGGGIGKACSHSLLLFDKYHLQQEKRFLY